MTDGTRATRRVLPALLALATATGGGPARAMDKQSCVTAAEAGQRLHKEHRLVAAREQLLQCSSPDCPRIVAADCTTWLGEVERKMASVLFRARDGQGRTLLDVKVLVDGNVLAAAAPSTPVDVDPGEHVFQCERAGAPPVEVRATLVDGERAHLVQCEMTSTVAAPAATGAVLPQPAAMPSAVPLPPSESPPASAGGGVPWPAWALGGLAVAGGAGWAFFGLSELQQQKSDAAAGGCKPTCSSAEISSIQTKIDLAYASAAVAVIALGAAVLIAIAAPPATSAPRK